MQPKLSPVAAVCVAEVVRQVKDDGNVTQGQEEGAQHAGEAFATALGGGWCFFHGGIDERSVLLLLLMLLLLLGTNDRAKEELQGGSRVQQPGVAAQNE